MRSRAAIAVAVVVAVVLAAVLIFAETKAVHAPEPIARDSFSPSKQSGMQDSSAPQENPEKPEAEPTTSPVVAGQPTLSDKPRVILRLIDDRTGKPLANVKTRIATLQWDSGRAFISSIPPKEVVLQHHEVTTTATGDVDPPDALDVESIRDRRVDIYPLPWNRLPVTDPTDVWLAVEAVLRGERRGPVEVRVMVGNIVTARCVYDDGEPVVGALVFANPLEPTRGIGDLVQWPEIDEWEAIPPAPERQVGKGTPEGVSFDFYPDRDHSELERAWEATSDEKGLARIEGLPSASLVFCATGKGLPKRVRTLDVARDELIEIAFPRPAEVLLHVQWAGSEPPASGDWQDLKVFGGEVTIYPEGNAEVSITLTGIAPGVYQVWPEGNPAQWLHLQAGKNEATIVLGKGAWCEWYCDFQVNNERMEIELLWKAEGLASDRYAGFEPFGWGTTCFNPGEPSRMSPGTFIVFLPDGTQQEVTFVPGVAVRTYLQMEVREVTFTISEELHRLLEPKGIPERPRISLVQGLCDADKYPQTLLAMGLANETGDSLERLRPDQPVTLALTPAMYWIELMFQDREVQAVVDLLDPSTRAIHLDINGWPGTGIYRVKTCIADDGSQSFFRVNDTRFGGPSHHYASIEVGEHVLAFWRPDGMTGYAFAASESDQYGHQGVWLPRPGNYEIAPADLHGQCSITFDGIAATQWVEAEVFWYRNGAEYCAGDTTGGPLILYADGSVYLDEAATPKDLAMDELPAGPVKIRLTRHDAKDRFHVKHDCALLELQLSGNQVVESKNLDWKPCGNLVVRRPKGSDACAECDGGLWGDFKESRFGAMVEFRRGPLAIGGHRIVIHNLGPLPEVRTIKIEAGKTTTIDLR